jgi:hypothetical protein
MKMSVKDAKKHPKKNGFFLHAQHRGSRSTKIEKTKKKQAEAENNELKTTTELHPVGFAYLEHNRS